MIEKQGEKKGKRGSEKRERKGERIERREREGEEDLELKEIKRIIKKLGKGKVTREEGIQNKVWMWEGKELKRAVERSAQRCGRKKSFRRDVERG